MDIELKDGTGSGNEARVGSNNRLSTSALEEPLQMHTSLEKGQSYQAEGTATVAAATTTVLSLENTSETLYMVITFIRAQIHSYSGGTALPDSATYFEYGHGRTRSSGGSTVTPANTNAGSSNAAAVTGYDTGPTMTGTWVGLDTWFPTSDGDKESWNKQGNIVIPPGKAYEARLVSDHTAGTIWTRTSFLMVDKEDL